MVNSPVFSMLFHVEGRTHQSSSNHQSDIATVKRQCNFSITRQILIYFLFEGYDACISNWTRFQSFHITAETLTPPHSSRYYTTIHSVMSSFSFNVSFTQPLWNGLTIISAIENSLSQSPLSKYSCTTRSIVHSSVHSITIRFMLVTQPNLDHRTRHNSSLLIASVKPQLTYGILPIKLLYSRLPRTSLQILLHHSPHRLNLLHSGRTRCIPARFVALKEPIWGMFNFVFYSFSTNEIVIVSSWAILANRF